MKRRRETFQRVDDIVNEQDRFSNREPGLTHPDLPSFIRLRNNGDIEIVGGENLAIVMNPRSGSITFLADHVKFITNHEGGLRWNRVTFNERATTFNEPTFIYRDETKEVGGNLYQDVDYFVDFERDEEETSVSKALIEKELERYSDEEE